MAEAVDRNIIIGKAGGNSGKNTVNYKVSLPASMIHELGITPEDKSVKLFLKDKKIIIEKA